MEPGWDDEVLDTGPRRPVPVRLLVVSVIALVLGVGLGFAAGHRTRSAGPAPPPRTTVVTATFFASATPSVPEVFAAFDVTGRRCAAIVGGKLQLGVQVANHSGMWIRLRELQPRLPLGGLRITATAVGSCGQLPPQTPVLGYEIAPESTAWLTATFDVQVRCPSYVPVNFTVLYISQGANYAADLTAFGDLGDVPYPCPSSSSSSSPTPSSTR